MMKVAGARGVLLVVVFIIALGFQFEGSLGSVPTFPPSWTTTTTTKAPTTTTTKPSSTTPSPTTTTTTQAPTSTSSGTSTTTSTTAPNSSGQSPIDATTYNNLVLFAQYASSAYANVGSSGCTTVNGDQIILVINNSTTDTQGFVTKSTARKAFVVAFRGTTSSQDQQTDADGTPTAWSLCSGCQVHHGFLTAWLSAKSAVVNAIQPLISQNPGYSLFVTGHSLGGGIVYLAAPDLKQALGLPTIAYSFGAPAAGNSAFASFLDSSFPATTNFFRGTHTNDGVPNSTGGYYSHSQTEYWQKADPSSQANVVKCSGDQNPNCNAGAGGSGINAAHNSYFGISIGQCFQ